MQFLYSALTQLKLQIGTAKGAVACFVHPIDRSLVFFIDSLQTAIQLPSGRLPQVMGRKQPALGMIRISRLMQVNRHYYIIAAFYKLLRQFIDSGCNINSRLPDRQTAVNKIIGEIYHDQCLHWISLL
ncbi:hypothetical protein D3C80_1725780 [compost metagenome]